MNSMNKILFMSVTALTASLFLFSCAQRSDTNSVTPVMAANILGGQVADLNFEQTNGVVGLVIMSKSPGKNLEGKPNISEAICTGTLIGKRTVLTAAHCLLDPNIADIVVVFNTDIDKASAQKTFMHASNAVPNENFSPSSKGGSFVDGKPWNDIAIIQLPSDAPANFQLAVLPTEKDLELLKKDTALTLTGYGVTTPLVNSEKIVNGKKVVTPIEGVSDTAGILRFVEAKVLVATKDNKEIEIDQDGGSHGACHGDSGGPAFIKNSQGQLIIIGVTSRGTDLNGNCDKQNVYTNVYGQLDWIKANLK